MDNPLMTPNKIQKWMNLAEGKSCGRIRLNYNKENVRNIHDTQTESTSPNNCELSSGILDLEQIEDFDHLDGESVSYRKSATFNPGEISGRSTCAEDLMSKTVPFNFELDQIAIKMDTQTSEIENVMRTSICTNFSLQSKIQLTAEEESFIRREGNVPVHPIQSLTSEDTATKLENLSVGTYFQSRCSQFGKILNNIESPDRSNVPCVRESRKSPVLKSPHPNRAAAPKQVYEINESLDCVPVRQPRDATDNKALEKLKSQNLKTIEGSKKHTPVPNMQEQHYHTFLDNQCSDKPLSKKRDTTKYASITINPMENHNPMQYNLQKKTLSTALNLMSDISESTENSISISKIADYIGNQSRLSVTELLNNRKKPQRIKSPLQEVQLNVQQNKINIHENTVSTHTKSPQQSETGSSAATVSTVMSLDKMRINFGKDIPEIVMTRDSLNSCYNEDDRDRAPAKSRSPLSKSPATLSTVRDNYSSYKSHDSGGTYSSPGDGSNASHALSPNIKYTELDKSIDWRALMEKGFNERGLAKDHWIKIATTTAKGFMGVECVVIATVTNLTDSWLTAKFNFDSVSSCGKYLNIELPRQPLLLSPKKTEKFNLHITSTIEMKGTIPFSVLLKDSSIESDIEVKQMLEIDIQVPIVQAMSSEGMNKINFPPTQENGKQIKYFVLLSDCPVDLQLDLSVFEGDSLFAIKNVQEIKRADIKKVLMERQSSTDEGQSGRTMTKGSNRQLCRLTSGNAIKVTMKFSAPTLSDLHITESLVTFNGALNVNLIGVNVVLRKIDLIGVVGSTKLIIKTPANKMCLTNEPTDIIVTNTGTVPGGWIVKFRNDSTGLPFKAVPSRFDLCPGGSKNIALTYMGAEENICEGSLLFEDMVTSEKTSIEVRGGQETTKNFPIKTNFGILSWVRSGRKELSLKNSTDKRIQLRCQVVGEGFFIDLPGRESGGVYSLQFGPCECRPLSVVFAPKTILPQKATLVLVYDNNGGLTRKVKLFGCESGESIRWSGLVTYGDTALVRAANRAPIHLEMYNKSNSANFVCAQIHFNVQFCWAEQGSRLLGGRNVVRGKSRHRLTLSVEWSRVERRARHSAPSALATLHVLTGHELTRRRILRIIKNDKDGKMDTSLLPQHLKVLTEHLEGEDPSMDELLEGFEETKCSLNELIGGLQELTAQIDLPQDYPDETTIIINDETIVEHHTLCD